MTAATLTILIGLIVRVLLPLLVVLALGTILKAIAARREA
jgi:hypothetical protein